MKVMSFLRATAVALVGGLFALGCALTIAIFGKPQASAKAGAACIAS